MRVQVAGGVYGVSVLVIEGSMHRHIEDSLFWLQCLQEGGGTSILYVPNSTSLLL